MCLSRGLFLYLREGRWDCVASMSMVCLDFFLGIYLICGAWVAILYSVLAQDACTSSHAVFSIPSMSHCLTQQLTGSGKIPSLTYCLTQQLTGRYRQ